MTDPTAETKEVQCPHCGRIYASDDQPTTCSDDCPSQEQTK